MQTLLLVKINSPFLPYQTTWLQSFWPWLEKCHFNWEQVIWRNQTKYAELEVRNQLFCVWCIHLLFHLPLILFKQQTLTSYHNILRKPFYSSVNFLYVYRESCQRRNCESPKTWLICFNNFSHYRDWSQYGPHRAEIRPRFSSRFST